MVRQDDPVDDAAWFAGLKEMTLADELADERAQAEWPPAPADEHDVVTPPPPDVRQEARARPQADVLQIVPASVPTSSRSVRRWVAIGAAVIVVLGAGVAVALNRGGPGGETTAGTSVPAQQAIVVAFSLTEQAAKAARGPTAPTKKKGSKADPTPAVQPQAGDVTGLSLLAVGGGSAQHVLVPSRLLLDVPGAGRVPMARSLAGSPDAPGEAITDALEVKVDATWTLDSGGARRPRGPRRGSGRGRGRGRHQGHAGRGGGPGGRRPAAEAGGGAGGAVRAVPRRRRAGGGPPRAPGAGAARGAVRAAGRPGDDPDGAG